MFPYLSALLFSRRRFSLRVLIRRHAVVIRLVHILTLAAVPVANALQDQLHIFCTKHTRGPEEELHYYTSHLFLLSVICSIIILNAKISIKTLQKYTRLVKSGTKNKMRHSTFSFLGRITHIIITKHYTIGVTGVFEKAEQIRGALGQSAGFTFGILAQASLLATFGIS